MALKETLLFLDLKEAGARIPRLSLPHKGLSARQEEVLLWDLGQWGAFSGTHDGPEHMEMTNPQPYYVHRAKGEVYNYERSPANGPGC